MSEYTNNYNLILPEQSENYNVDVANTNNKTIDTYLGNKVDKIPGKGLSTNDFTNGYKKKVDALQSLYRFKGNVDTLQELNSKTNNNIGDVWKCLGNSKNYCWNEEEWVDIGNDIDLSAYALQEDLEEGLEEKADNDSVEEEFETIREEIQEISAVPSGGLTGQILAKASSADNDVEWIYNDGGITGDTFPIGAITGFGGTAPPENWLICDGRAISRIEYARLFAAIGTTYGTGDGSTTFNIPDLKGKVPVGLNSSDTDFDTLGEIGGEKTHTLTTDEMPSHSHKSEENKTHSAGAIFGYSAGGTNTANYGGSSGMTYKYLKDANTSSVGSGQAHNNLQPYTVTNYIIKAYDSASGNTDIETLPVGTELDFDGQPEDIPIGWEEINDNKKILWTNSSPTSNFAAQDITLNSSDYDCYEIIFLNNMGEDLYYNTGKIPKGHGCRLVECYSGGSGAAMRTREVNYSSATQLEFKAGRYAYGTTAAIDNNATCIPLYVIGYKTGLFN